MTIEDGSPPHPHDMAAANHTLSCDKTLPILVNSLKRHFRCGFTHLSLRRCCASQVAILERSASVATPSSPYPGQAFDHALGCNLAPAAKCIPAKLQVLVHSVSGNPNVSFPVSTVVISTNSSHLDVTIDHETLKP